MAQAAGALGWQLSGADLKRIGTSSLAKFELLGEIGRGSFSVVHKARSTVDGTLVAIKKVKAKEMLDEKARRDCEQEVALLQKIDKSVIGVFLIVHPLDLEAAVVTKVKQRLDHPQIIKYLSSFFEDGELFIVLELAGGGDLARFIKVCAALKHMHLKRIMHRDVKPANVFITIDGRVKLGDLGLGRFFSPDSVAANSLVGTPYYMSPERVQRHEYDFSSDVWSAGCLLYEMAALQSPFANDMKNSYSLVKKIVSSEYPPISSNLYSDELRALVAVCMDPNPKKRRDIIYACTVATQMFERFVRSSACEANTLAFT